MATRTDYETIVDTMKDRWLVEGAKRFLEAARSVLNYEQEQ